MVNIEKYNNIYMDFNYLYGTTTTHCLLNVCSMFENNDLFLNFNSIMCDGINLLKLKMLVYDIIQFI